MQAEIETSRKSTQPGLREIPEKGVPEFLKEEKIGTIETGVFVPLKRVASVRVSLTNIHTYTDKRFTTEQTESGIILWRTA